MALARAIVCLTDLAFIHIFPFIPTAISKDSAFPSDFSSVHSGFKSLEMLKS